jgi:hypothetical protein
MLGGDGGLFLASGSYADSVGNGGCRRDGLRERDRGGQKI